MGSRTTITSSWFILTAAFLSERSLLGEPLLEAVLHTSTYWSSRDTSDGRTDGAGHTDTTSYLCTLTRGQFTALELYHMDRETQKRSFKTDDEMEAQKGPEY